IIEIDFNGSVTASCGGNTPRCETPAEAIARFDSAVAAQSADADPTHIYFFAFTIHSNGVWNDFNRAAGGQTMVGEGAGLLTLMDAIESRKNAGTRIQYVTPSELAAIFEDANPAATTYTTETIETRVTAPNGNRVYTRVIQPVPSLYPGQRFPALIAIPGGTGPGAPLADNPGYRSFAASGFVVVVFNPEGRGTGAPGNLLSDGAEDCNGFIHQDDLKAVVEYTAGLSNVNASNIGVETASFGIAIGAGALGRYPNLPVKYLVDQEGPHDSRVITFYDVSSERAVCGHWSTVTDPSLENQTFWAEREAVRHIGGFRGMYLRMQAETDHAQGADYFRHTIEMVNAATSPAYGGTGSACWTRVNGADIGNPINSVYLLSDPNQYPSWVTGKLADHPGLNLDYDREMSALSCPAASAPIPTVSQWGLVALTLLLLTAATFVIRHTRHTRTAWLTLICCAVLIALMTASAPARAAQSPAGGGFVLVTERAGTTVAKIDVDTDQIIGRATVGNQPSDLAADHLRRWVYVAANLDHKIVAMKADTLETADLNITGLGKQPIGVEITPDGGTLLVTTRGSDGIISADDRLDVIRLNASSWPPTGSLIASISTGLHPIGACLARDGRHAVITVRNQPAILIVDLQTNQIVGQAQNLPLDAEPEGCDAHPTANVVYVTLHGPVSTVEVFDLDTLTLVTHMPIVHTPPARPSTGVFTPDGRRFYVSGQSVNKVFLFETSDPLNPVQNMAVQLPVGQQPHFIVYLPGDRAYVANTNNEQPYGSLAIIHGYSAAPTVSGPILTTLAGPLRFVKFSSAGSGDFDSDGDVDADDSARFETCFTGANGGPIDPGCEPGDFDLDNDIDCVDWEAFALAWTAPGQPPELAQCAGASIPAISEWGALTTSLLVLTAGTLIAMRRGLGGSGMRRIGLPCR
ncbi:MAG: hypothetical protein Q7R41_04120, partial [Phycisphaerales bacterium]|nr:hypothetical protein [Phycisphaerales bacterium]